jgi:hypothetical protein
VFWAVYLIFASPCIPPLVSIQLITHSIPYHVNIGDIIYDNGDVAEEIAFVMRGGVRITVNDGVNDVTVGYTAAGKSHRSLSIFELTVIKCLNGTSLIFVLSMVYRWFLW